MAKTNRIGKAKGGNKGKTNAKKELKNPGKQKNHMSVCFYGDTNVGLHRKNNEDNFVCQKIWDRNVVLAIAIDGLGGYEGGEVAAQIAKEEIVKNIEASSNGECLEMLKQAVASANNTILEASQNEPKYNQMGCVLTAIIVDVENKKVYMAHVGDSRLYCFNEGGLEKLSHDHSPVGYREETGELSEEAAMHHPQRNIVDRVIGHEYHLASDRDFIEAKEFPLHNNSTFLLCSDGLTDMITSSAISSILRGKDGLKEKVDALINAALKAGGKDNVTVVLVEYLNDEAETPVVNVGDNKTTPIVQETEAAEEDVPAQLVEKKQKPSWWLAIAFLVIGFMVGFWCGRTSMPKQTNNANDNPTEQKTSTLDTLAIDEQKTDSTSIDSTIVDSTTIDTTIN